MITSADILNAKILIVDDKQPNVDLLERMLRGAGYTSVHSTTDSSQVSILHTNNRYDLILLDLMMPGMDGFQVMESLKEIEGDGYLPVLVITAQPAHKLRALEAGAKDFVSKPFDMAELRARVHNILEVRLLHIESKTNGAVLQAVVQALEASREVVLVKTEQEITLAQKTQESLLPHVLPQFENFHIHAFNKPTAHVGGDFYDFRHLNAPEAPPGFQNRQSDAKQLGHQQLCAKQWMGVLADVSGKGVPAALYSALVLGALSMEFRSRTEPHEVLNRVNQLLCEKSLPSQFVTLFLLRMCPDGAGQFISAGHTPTYLYRSSTGKIEELVSDAYMLGMFPFHSYRSRKLQLDRGDILVVYTDGLTKAENPRNGMFGEERLREVIQQEAHSGGKAVEQGILKHIEDFTQGTPQMDDISF
ncbi:MAG: SpoIIE family protein phosphatase, partial [Acidobacteriota bacterium]